MPYKTLYKKVLKNLSHFVTLILVSGVSVAPVTVDAVGNLLRGRGHLPRVWLAHIMIYIKTLTGLLFTSLQCLVYWGNRLRSFISSGGGIHHFGNFSAVIYQSFNLEYSVWKLNMALIILSKKVRKWTLMCPPWFVKPHSWKSFQFHLILFQFLQTFCVWIC